MINDLHSTKTCEFNLECKDQQNRSDTLILITVVFRMAPITMGVTLYYTVLYYTVQLCFLSCRLKLDHVGSVGSCPP